MSSRRAGVLSQLKNESLSLPSFFQEFAIQAAPHSSPSKAPRSSAAATSDGLSLRSFILKPVADFDLVKVISEFQDIGKLKREDAMQSNSGVSRTMRTLVRITKRFAIRFQVPTFVQIKNNQFILTAGSRSAASPHPPPQSLPLVLSHDGGRLFPFINPERKIRIDKKDVWNGGTT